MRSIRIHKALLFTLGSLVGTTAAIAQTIIPAGFGAMSVTQPSRETAVLTGILNSTGGQNPTVKIRWGDEDRGTAVTPSTAWDNEVTISTNQAAGTFSTTITIPNLEKVYYFRAIASNSGGTVVSRSLGVLLPSAPVGVANLQGRWNFDSENANDSSGTGRHGTAKKLFSLTASSDMKLWLDASDLSAAGASWDDDSGNSNDATKGGSPVVIENAQNGHSIMHYNADGQRHKFNMISDIRTVFWVISIDEAYKSSGFRYVLSDSTKHPHWHNNNDGKLFGSYSSSNITGGTIRLNGSTINGTTTNQPTSLSILTVKTTANVDADQFGYDRTITSRQWRGKLGELIIFNSAKSDADIEKIEGYLAHKWGLAGALDSAHPHKLGAPIASSGSPTYITDTPFGSGKAIDLADGHVEVSTGESEDVFDGGSAFSVSAWVKGWPADDLAPFVSKGAVIKTPKDVPSLKLWLSSTDLSTMDKSSTLGGSGPPSTDGDLVKYWGDKSGNSHHATSTGSPKYKPNGVHGKYPAIETNGGALVIQDSATAFDAWDSMTMIYVNRVYRSNRNHDYVRKWNSFLFGRGWNEALYLRHWNGSAWIDVDGGYSTWAVWL